MRRSLVLICLTAAVAGCGGASSDTSTGTPSNPTRPPRTFGGGCTRVAQPDPKQNVEPSKPTSPLAAGKTYTVDIATNCGKISIRLDTARAPKTAASFASLVRQGFYDDLTFHRVSNSPTGDPFVIQGGDPLGTGQGGPGYTVVERPPRGLKYTRGVVAMAKTGSDPKGASGSQFFIVTAEDAGLPADYALVGKVVAGDSIVTRISKLDTDPQSEQPLLPVVIQKATLRTS